MQMSDWTSDSITLEPIRDRLRVHQRSSSKVQNKETPAQVLGRNDDTKLVIATEVLDGRDILVVFVG